MLQKIKTKLKKILPFTLSMALISSGANASVDANVASRSSVCTSASGRILFLPQDNRPASYQETIEVAESAGFKLIVPGEEILSRGTDTPGDPDALLTFVENNAKKANAAVISTDALLYGGLIPSRKHNISEEKLNERINRLSKVAEDNPNLKIYLFASLMRTPKTGADAGKEEPDYYMQKSPEGFEYGADIFRLSALMDKEELNGLSTEEINEKNTIKNRLPKHIWNDWIRRRNKNIKATVELLELTKKGMVKMLVLGRDDNAPLSRTHHENRKLLEKVKASNLPKNSFFSMAGIDEFNLLLLARAANEMTYTIPKVYVEYVKGVGGNTIPAYSDVTIAESIAKEIDIAGGVMTNDIKNADVVLMVNTDIKGRTGAANNWNPKYTDLPNDSFEREGSNEFFSRIKDYTEKNYPVAIADIVFANGADYYLMRNLKDNKMFYSIKAYAGWNTPTNSAGSALAQGMFAMNTPEDKKNQILFRRYLNDWAYQTVIRTYMYSKLYEREEPELYLELGSARRRIEEETTNLVYKFAKEELPYNQKTETFRIVFPWNRMFNCKIEME